MTSKESRHFVILSKLDQIGQPMSLLEIGFTASPQCVRNMAARGMVKVTVAMTERGKEVLRRERIKRLKRLARDDKRRHACAITEATR